MFNDLKNKNILCQNNNLNDLVSLNPVQRTNELVGLLVSNGSANGSPVYKRPRGGLFYLNSNNNKSYVTGLNNHIRFIF